MILDTPNRSLRILLGEAQSVASDIVCCYAQQTAAGGFVTTLAHTASNGTSPVTLAGPPQLGVQLMVNEVRVHNKDSIAHTVTLQLLDGATTRIVYSGSVAAGADWCYTPEAGVTGPPGPAGPAGPPGAPGGGSGTVTSITTGAGLVGGTITTAGTISLASPVAVASGGTGATTAGAALTALGAYPAANPSGYISSNQTVTLSGDVTGSGATAITTALATSGVVAGSYTNSNITVDSKGRVTAASSGAVDPQLPNYVINPGFSVNQRGYTSGTALAAAAYGHDRWKAGASGCTLTFTASPPSTTVTITAGSLQQVVEGASLVGGSYVLSWTGTAQGRFGAASYAASPVTATITAGTNTTIEFNAGTLSQVKLERGSVASAWTALPVQQELALCQRYYQTLSGVAAQGYTASGSSVYADISYNTAMRTNPTGSFANITYNNASGLAANSSQVTHYRVSFVVTGTGYGYVVFDMNLSAEL